MTKLRDGGRTSYDESEHHNYDERVGIDLAYPFDHTELFGTLANPTLWNVGGQEVDDSGTKRGGHGSSGVEVGWYHSDHPFRGPQPLFP